MPPDGFWFVIQSVFEPVYFPSTPEAYSIIIIKKTEFFLLCKMAVSNLYNYLKAVRNVEEFWQRYFNLRPTADRSVFPDYAEVIVC
jgi:hypothetical protein